MDPLPSKCTSPLEACVYYFQGRPLTAFLGPQPGENPRSYVEWLFSSCAGQFAVVQGLCAKRETG